MKPPIVGLKKFSQISNVPVHWMRLGLTGERWIDSGFLDMLENAFNELWSISGRGQAKAIVSLGAFVNRPYKEGDRHATGTAIDIASIVWDDFKPIEALLAAEQPVTYLATESIFRRHIPQCLNWWYNGDHHSHWHLDDRKEAEGIQKYSKADTFYLQAVLRYIYNCNEIAIDGIFGKETESALNSVGYSHDNWREFMLKVAKDVFASSPDGI